MKIHCGGPRLPWNPCRCSRSIALLIELIWCRSRRWRRSWVHCKPFFDPYVFLPICFIFRPLHPRAVLTWCYCSTCLMKSHWRELKEEPVRIFITSNCCSIGLKPLFGILCDKLKFKQLQNLLIRILLQLYRTFSYKFAMNSVASGKIRFLAEFTWD